MTATTLDWTEGGLRRTIEIDSRQRAATTRIEHRGLPLLTPGWASLAVGWRLRADGELLHGASESVRFAGWRMQGTADRTAAPNDRVVQHRATQTPLAIDLHIRSFADAPAQIQWLEIRNEGDRPIVVSDVQSLELPLTPAPLERTEVFHDFCAAPAHRDHYGGMDDPALRIHEPETGRGLYLLNLGPGLVRRSIAQVGYTPFSTLGYDTARFPVEVDLAPGATFTADPVGLLAYDCDPEAALRSFAERHLAARPLPRPPIVYNTWQPFALAIDEALLVDLVDRGADLGFEIFSVDDGWQEHQGLWREHPGKFPRGLGPIADRARRRGLSLGLWMGLATQSAENDVVRSHPEWLARNPDGSVRVTDTAQGRVPFFCLATGYADWIAEEFAAVVRRLDLSYVKVDLTTVVQIYGERAGCFAPHHGHRSPGDFALQVYRAIERIADRWRRERPGLLVDLTYELWGGHHAIDYALLRAGDVDWLSNILDTAGLGAPRAARRLARHRARCIPPGRLLVGNLRADGPDPIASAASSLASVPLLLGDLRAVGPDAAQRIRRIFDAYRRSRDAFGVDRFVPLDSGATDAAPSWDGFYRGDDRGNGFVALFRNGAAASEPPHVPLPAAASGRLECTDVLTDSRFVTTAKSLRQSIPAAIAAGPHLLLELRAI